MGSLSNQNAQGEYYLTDVVAMAVSEQIPVEVAHAVDEYEVLGANNRVQLAVLEAEYRRRQAERLMTEGVSLADPARIDVRGDVSVGRDISIDINVVLEGRVVIEDDVIIESNCVLRPGTRLQAGAKIGNFVETKKADIGAGAKVNHLSYIGDAVVGPDVNIGAGTITCNYDGANKHLTTIEEGAFIGTNTALVAPVTIGARATTAAGSTITANVPADTLAVSRARQRNIDGWKRPTKS